MVVSFKVAWVQCISTHTKVVHRVLKTRLHYYDSTVIFHKAMQVTAP